MNIRDLKYLIAIAEHAHFGMAADACFVSQPALSMQIKKLESTLGVQLIERTSKSARLTEIGAVITDHARDIISRVDTLKEVAKQAKDPFSGELRLGIIPTVAPYLLPHIMKGLAKAFPKVTIYLFEEQTATLVSQLKQGKLDAAVFGLPTVDNEYDSMPLYEEEFLLAVPPKHALAKKKVIKLSDLKNRNLLLLEDGHCMRDIALELCYRAEANETKGFKGASLETLRHMVASGAGMTLMPKMACKGNDGVCYLEFANPKPIRSIGITWRGTSAKKMLLHSLSNKIKDSIRKKSLLIYKE